MSATAPRGGSADADAAARSLAWLQLARLLRYPGATGSGEGDPRRTVARLLEALAALPYELKGLGTGTGELLALAASDADARSAWSSAYTALFDNGRGRPAVSPYEKDYGLGDGKAIWEELIRFYEHFGLSFDVHVARDWPDHVATQCEFLHYLTYLEAAATVEGARSLRLAQGDLLARHLGRWAPRFAQRVQEVADNGPYGLFARVAAAFARAELDHLGRALDDKASVPQREAQAGLPGAFPVPVVAQDEGPAFVFELP